MCKDGSSPAGPLTDSQALPPLPLSPSSLLLLQVDPARHARLLDASQCQRLLHILHLGQGMCNPLCTAEGAAATPPLGSPSGFTWLCGRDMASDGRRGRVEHGIQPEGGQKGARGWDQEMGSGVGPVPNDSMRRT